MKTQKTLTFLVTAVLVLGLCALAAGEKAAPSQETPALQGKLNINTASLKQIKLLPGIGKKTAAMILDYRTSNGNFKTVEDLLKIKGLGKKTLEKCRPYLTLAGETTLAKKKP